MKKIILTILFLIIPNYLFAIGGVADNVITTQNPIEKISDQEWELAKSKFEINADGASANVNTQKQVVGDMANSILGEGPHPLKKGVKNSVNDCLENYLGDLSTDWDLNIPTIPACGNDDILELEDMVFDEINKHSKEYEKSLIIGEKDQTDKKSENKCKTGSGKCKDAIDEADDVETLLKKAFDGVSGLAPGQGADETTDKAVKKFSEECKKGNKTACELSTKPITDQLSQDVVLGKKPKTTKNTTQSDIVSSKYASIAIKTEDKQRKPAEKQFKHSKIINSDWNKMITDMPELARTQLVPMSYTKTGDKKLMQVEGMDNINTYINIGTIETYMNDKDNNKKDFKNSSQHYVQASSYLFYDLAKMVQTNIADEAKTKRTDNMLHLGLMANDTIKISQMKNLQKEVESISDSLFHLRAKNIDAKIIEVNGNLGSIREEIEKTREQSLRYQEIQLLIMSELLKLNGGNNLQFNQMINDFSQNFKNK